MGVCALGCQGEAEIFASHVVSFTARFMGLQYQHKSELLFAAYFQPSYNKVFFQPTGINAWEKMNLDPLVPFSCAPHTARLDASNSNIRGTWPLWIKYLPSSNLLVSQLNDTLLVYASPRLCQHGGSMWVTPSHRQPATCLVPTKG